MRWLIQRAKDALSGVQGVSRAERTAHAVVALVSYGFGLLPI